MLPNILPRRLAEQRKTDAHRQYLRGQAKMGGSLFGPVPQGHRREFFCLDRHTWVWHEEWKDAKGQTQSVTTRYDVSPRGVLKSQGSRSYQQVTGQELNNFYHAIMMYRDNLSRQLADIRQ